jgi:hypothetical protein
MTQLLLDLDIIRYGPWYETTKSDQDCRKVFDRHYTRKKEKIGNSGWTRPGENMILRTQRGDAIWCSWRSQFRKDGFDAIECTAFRNEGMRLSSTLIKWAVYATLKKWGPKLPSDGILTYVNDDAVSSRNKGYCYLKAGFVRVGRSKSRNLTTLLLTPDACEIMLSELSMTEALKSVKWAMRLAMRSGEHTDALDFQQEAIEIEIELQQMKALMKKAKLKAWSEIVPPLRKDEFLISLYGWVPADCMQDLAT